MAHSEIITDDILSNPIHAPRLSSSTLHDEGRCALQFLADALEARADACQKMEVDDLYGATHIIRKALATWENGWKELEGHQHQA